jgi:hypothetical protein
MILCDVIESPSLVNLKLSRFTVVTLVYKIMGYQGWAKNWFARKKVTGNVT